MEQLILIVFWGWLRHLADPLTFLFTSPWSAYVLFAGLIVISVTVPLLLLRKHPGLQEKVYSVLERLTLLSGLYLFIDVIGMIIILIRNIKV